METRSGDPPRPYQLYIKSQDSLSATRPILDLKISLDRTRQDLTTYYMLNFNSFSTTKQIFDLKKNTYFLNAKYSPHQKHLLLFHHD